jgi:GH25 family lysozyme M1 (1,4-beta-N-acetylmuramidase)
MVAYADPKVEFVGCRATVSWGYTDAWFDTYWKELKARGIPRMAYHVVYPAQDPIEQVKKFLSVVGEDIGEGPLVIDAELDHGQSPKVISDCIGDMVTALFGATGKYPVIYTRPGWVRQFMEPRSWFDKVWWWMATYTFSGVEHNGTGVKEASIAAGVPANRVVIHQTSHKGKGSAFGVESGDLDYDRWWGTPAQLAEFFSLPTQPPVPPEPPEEPVKIELIVPQGAEVTVTEK